MSPAPGDREDEALQPYRYVQTDSDAELRGETAEEEGKRHFRRALHVVLLSWFGGAIYFLVDEHGIYRNALLVFGLFVFGFWYLLLSVFGFRVLMLASATFHWVFGKSVARSDWQDATCRALWTLPYGIAIGVAILVVNKRPGFGGWPGDVIAGTIANLVGAWMYLTIFRSWYLLRKAASAPPAVETGSPLPATQDGPVVSRREQSAVKRPWRIDG